MADNDEILTGIYDGFNCNDCGPYNILDISEGKCCPRPMGKKTPEEMWDVSCCPLIYTSPGQITCYKKTKFNTPFYVAGPKGPVKYRNLPSNTFMTLRTSANKEFGPQIPRQRIQRGKWNNSYSNTKLHPVIGIFGDNSGNPIGYKQSKNMFKNTSWNMTKKEKFAYFSKHGRNIYR